MFSKKHLVLNSLHDLYRLRIKILATTVPSYCDWSLISRVHNNYIKMYSCNCLYHALIYACGAGCNFLLQIVSCMGTVTAILSLGRKYTVAKYCSYIFNVIREGVISKLKDHLLPQSNITS